MQTALQNHNRQLALHFAGLKIQRVELKPNDIVFKYSEDVDRLRDILSELKISIEIAGYDYYFEGDKEKRIILRVYLERRDAEVDFRFGMSTHDSELLLFKLPSGGAYFGSGYGRKFYENHYQLVNDQRKVAAGLYYSILACCGSDWVWEYLVEFDEFCANFGYDTDSIRASNLHKRFLEQGRKLASIFTEDEIASFPH